MSLSEVKVENYGPIMRFIRNVSGKLGEKIITMPQITPRPTSEENDASSSNLEERTVSSEVYVELVPDLWKSLQINENKAELSQSATSIIENKNGSRKVVSNEQADNLEEIKLESDDSANLETQPTVKESATMILAQSRQVANQIPSVNSAAAHTMPRSHFESRMMLSKEDLDYLIELGIITQSNHKKFGCRISSSYCDSIFTELKSMKAIAEQCKMETNDLDMLFSQGTLSAGTRLRRLSLLSEVYVVVNEYEVWKQNILSEYHFSALNELLSVLKNASNVSSMGNTDSSLRLSASSITAQSSRSSVSHGSVAPVKLLSIKEFKDRLRMSLSDLEYLRDLGIIKTIKSAKFKERISEQYIDSIFNSLLAVTKAVSHYRLTDSDYIDFTKTNRELSINNEKWVVISVFENWLNRSKYSILTLTKDETKVKMKITEEDLDYLISKQVVSQQDSNIVGVPALVSWNELLVEQSMINVKHVSNIYGVSLREFLQTVSESNGDLRLVYILDECFVHRQSSIEWCDENVNGQDVRHNLMNYRHNNDENNMMIAYVNETMSRTGILLGYQMSEEDVKYLIQCKLLSCIASKRFGERFQMSALENTRGLLTTSEVSEIYKVPEDEFIETISQSDGNEAQSSDVCVRIVSIRGKQYVSVNDCIAWSTEDAHGNDIREILTTFS